MKAEIEPGTDASSVKRSGAGAFLVASGILLSRVLGVVRESLKARYLGASENIAADAFNAAFRIPNLLQVLFGEGVLSASFIPVYAQLVAREKHEEAGRVAGAVFALLALVTTILVLLGVLFAPVFVAIIAAGFSGEKRELTVQITRILFPGVGLLVLSAWCLGVLNTHRRFFLSYAAPAVSNVAMIVALVLARNEPSMTRIAIQLAWASVIGAGLVFLVQLPAVLRLVPELKIALDYKRNEVRTITRNFLPVFVSRGVVQLSATIDQILASYLPTGVVSLLFYAQTVSILPVSLFGMSVAASELPEMSRTVGTEDETARQLRERLNNGLRQIAFFVVPSAAAMLVLGDVITRALFQSGKFTAMDTLYTWGIFAGSAVGLLASTMGRLYSSVYYALLDTRSPLRFAIVRVLLTTVLGYLFAFPLPRMLGIAGHWGAAGLTASAGIAGWVEFSLLRSRLNRRIGNTGLSGRHALTLWLVALGAASVAFALKQWLDVVGLHRLIAAVITLGTFGAVYLVATRALHVRESAAVFSRVRSLFG